MNLLKTLIGIVVTLAVGLPAWGQDAAPQGTLTLAEAINVALKNHPAIMENKEKVDAAKAQVGVSRSKYFPQVQYSDNMYYGNTFPSTSGSAVTGQSGTSGGIPGTSSYSPTSGGFGGDAGYYYIHRFTANQMLYDFGKTGGTVGQSKANYDASRMDLANTRQQVVVDAKTAYYALLATKRAVKVSEENLRLNQELVRQAEGFYRVGVRARIDVTKAEANLYNAESDLITAKNSHQVSRVNLMTAMGLKSWPYQDLDDVLDFKPLQLSLEQAKEQAFTNRPELRKNQYLQEAGKEGVKVARAGYFPNLNSQAIYGWQGAQRPMTDNWYVGASVNFPLFEGLSTTYTYRQSKANLRATEANGQVLSQNVNREVEQSFLEVKAAAERIRSTAKAREAARENWRLAEGRYKAGVGSIIEVTDAQVQYFQSELNNIRALYDYKTFQARLDKAIGKAY